MEQTFLEKLKRVKPGDLLHIIKFILAFPIAMVYRLFRRDLWLLCDTENECRDNGFWLYKYLRENTSEDAVYAINRKSPDYARVKDLFPDICAKYLKRTLRNPLFSTSAIPAPPPALP